MEPNLILYKLLPFSHDACRDICTVRERTVGVDAVLIEPDASTVDTRCCLLETQTASLVGRPTSLP